MTHQSTAVLLLLFAAGGVVLLAIAGSLPELAITISAAAAGNLGLASGNLIDLCGRDPRPSRPSPPAARRRLVDGRHRLRPRRHRSRRHRAVSARG